MKTARLAQGIDTTCPVLLLGGEENALEIARHFHRLGITVRISGAPGCWALESRDCAESLRIPRDMSTHDYWRALLLTEGETRFDGHVIFAMSDDAISFVIDHEAALRARYRLERFDGDLRVAMLDKRRTLELAADVGVPAPQFWPIETIEDVEALRGALTFPVMVKPVHSHLFVRAFGKKLFIIEADFDDLVAKARRALDNGLAISVVEMIPGPDSLLSSYYTYIDARGTPLFHYTKRIVRRFPTNSGGAVYHVTEWLPDTAEMGLRYLRGIGWRGLANIEFKRDTRDGQLKVIEVNARYTAAHRLLVASGAPVDLVAYCDLTDQPAPVFTSYRQDMRLWMPIRDFRAFLELRRQGKLGLGGWLASLPLRRTIGPLFSLRDPMPSVEQLRFSLVANWHRFWAHVR
jgi:predicted ATP-grasp superfamily ATP-dependent carboligase